MYVVCKFPISFVSKPEHANPLDAEPTTDFNAKVIYFDVAEGSTAVRRF